MDIRHRVAVVRVLSGLGIEGRMLMVEKREFTILEKVVAYLFGHGWN